MHLLVLLSLSAVTTEAKRGRVPFFLLDGLQMTKASEAQCYGQQSARSARGTIIFQPT